MAGVVASADVALYRSKLAGNMRTHFRTGNEASRAGTTENHAVRAISAKIALSSLRSSGLGST